MKHNNFFRAWLLLLITTLFFVVLKWLLPSSIFEEKLHHKKAVDQLLSDALAEKDNEDATLSDTTIYFSGTNNIVFPPEKGTDYKGYQHLISFYQALERLENYANESVRIAYFGDSMTDGDYIVQDIRQLLQKQFGGEGVGFVPITSESAASRNSIQHQFSTNWKLQSSLTIKKPLFPFGVTGHVFYYQDTLQNPWVLYKNKITASKNSLHNPTLFYGKSDNLSGQVQLITHQDTVYKTLNPTGILNAKVLKSGIKYRFIKAQNIPFYGVNFDDGKGIHVDNFSTRGHSGLPLLLHSKPLMNAFQQQLKYQLIVLQYGTNVLGYGTLKYNWYQRKMKKVVQHIRECFPGAAILVVSIADKSTKYNLEMKTDSAVVPLLSAQKKYAIASQTSFFDLYKAMGGNASMKKWVEQNPPLANKDYTHFNHLGAQKAGKMIVASLLNGFQDYKKLKISANQKKNKGHDKK